MSTHRLFSAAEREVATLARAFLNGRLEERDTIEWALALSPGSPEARAVLQVLHYSENSKLKEPWHTAWRLIEESWRSTLARDEDSDVRLYQVSKLVKAGDESGVLITKIVDLVQPFLEVKALSDSDKSIRNIPEKPKNWSQILRASLSSGKLIDPEELGVKKIANISFLLELASKLDAALQHGLGIGRRLGWTGQGNWRLGQLHRVYFAKETEGHHEPDAFHRGIAPCVKLLFSVYERLRDIAPDQGVAIARSWRFRASDLYTRMWSAAARNPVVASADQVAEFLLGLDWEHFWDIRSYPEIAELRVVRFNDLVAVHQNKILASILKGPPSKLWGKKPDKEHLAEFKNFWINRECRRLVTGGAVLHGDALLRGQIQPPPDPFGDELETGVQEGFPETPRAKWVAPNPDNRFDKLEGDKRLSELQKALTSARASWKDNPSERALDWIRVKRNCGALIGDFESSSDRDSYPNVWEAFGWYHTQRDIPADQVDSTEPTRVIGLLLSLSQSTIKQAIEGLTHWLSHWEGALLLDPRRYELWKKLWPAAEAATNSQRVEHAEPSLNVVLGGENDVEGDMDMDSLNTAAGRMVGLFFAFCPEVPAVAPPFEADSPLYELREMITGSSDRANLIAFYRLIQALSYFLNADPEWANRILIAPLKEEGARYNVLWRAVAQRARPRDVIDRIGNEMAMRASDLSLPRSARQGLAWNVVIDSLWSFKDGKKPAVERAMVQQMLRMIDDDVRSHTADALRLFVQEASAKRDADAKSSPEDVFRFAVKPLLELVWPQERVEVTPGISKALANLPAACGTAFPEAVDLIERFLVPFECWSLIDYGLYGDDDGVPKLDQISTSRSAAALLKLLNATIGSSDESIIPMDLSDALSHIEKVDGKLVETQAFRRLAALARR